MNPDRVSPLDFLRAPLVACASVTREAYLTPEELHDWATVQVRVCKHTRDFVQSCQVCRDVQAVIGALDTVPCVRVIPRRTSLKA